MMRVTGIRRAIHATKRHRPQRLGCKPPSHYLPFGVDVGALKIWMQRNDPSSQDSSNSPHES